MSPASRRPSLPSGACGCRGLRSRRPRWRQRLRLRARRNLARRWARRPILQSRGGRGPAPLKFRTESSGDLRRCGPDATEPSRSRLHQDHDLLPLVLDPDRDLEALRYSVVEGYALFCESSELPRLLRCGLRLVSARGKTSLLCRRARSGTTVQPRRPTKGYALRRCQRDGCNQQYAREDLRRPYWRPDNQ